MKERAEVTEAAAGVVRGPKPFTTFCDIGFVVGIIMELLYTFVLVPNTCFFPNNYIISRME